MPSTATIVTESAVGARLHADPTVDVLHVPYTYFPDAAGGTEVYVAQLVGALRDEGFSGAVAAPGDAETAYRHDDVPVFRFVSGRAPALTHAHGAPDEIAARSFAAVLARIRPRIVHLHARTAAVSELIAEAACDAGCRVVFTYHTPTVSCSRGTMMRMGRWHCDGVLDRRRCTVCTLEQHHVPPLLRGALALMPDSIGEGVGRAGLAGRAVTAIRMGSLIGSAQRRFHEFMDKADRVVAVCGWVAEVLRANGVPEEKLVLCRQGLTARRARPPAPDINRGRTGPVRLGYFGRLDPAKGVDLVVTALRRAPELRVQFTIYGVSQPGSEAHVHSIRQAAADDARIRILPPVSPDEVDALMRECDLVVVPSRWLETGPLVVLEAFGAGTPVLGARLGGIAELVTDGVDGVLVPPDDPVAWAETIVAIVAKPERVTALRAGIRPPRTMTEVAGEMASLYQGLLSGAAG